LKALPGDQKDEQLIKNRQTHNMKNWNMQTLFQSFLNISAKSYQNRTLQFWAIPF